MDVLRSRQKKLEKKIEKYDSDKNVWAFILNSWLCYRLTRDSGYINKALNTLIEMREFSNIGFCLWTIFLNIELNNIAEAIELSDGLKTHINYYRNNDLRIYSVYVFLQALIYIRTGKRRQAVKQYNKLTEIDDGPVKGLNYLLLGIINYEMEDYDTAAEGLAYAYAYGYRNVFLFLAALELFNNAEIFGDNFDENLFFGVISWSMHKNIDISGIIVSYKQKMAEIFPRHKLLQREIYKKYPTEELLVKICLDFMGNIDYTSEAFYFYKDAEEKQLELPNIYAALIKSAEITDNENVSRYTIDRFLKAGTADNDLLLFVYHMIITRPKNSELLKEYRADITAFAAEALKRSEAGRYYNSIYTVFLESGTDDKALTERAEKLIYEDLFKFRLYINDSNIKCIWIAEKEFDRMHEYFLTGKTKIIIASDREFTAYFLDANKSIVDINYKLARLVENAGIDLYKRFFKKGWVSPELLVVLCNYYMSLDYLPAESIGVFSKAISNREISPGYKMVIYAARGNYYTDQGDYKRAVQCYKDVDENDLNDRYIERMLTAYTGAEEFARAVGLIVKKAECISDKALFFALKKIIGIKTYDKDIANVAYELTLKSWYDKDLIAVVLKHYNGSQEEWQNLSGALAAMSLEDRKLDEIILKNAIWMHIFDKGSQDVFRRMYNMDRTNALLEEYCRYCIYEMIINNAKPEYETVKIFEEMFKTADDSFIGYALCHYYINYGVMSSDSEGILKAAMERGEKEGVIFPVFKRLKDKPFINSYIESNQPFIYRSLPGRTIKLFYKIENETDFRPKIMKYVKFGMYFAHIPHFYGEKIIYYFSEEMETGSIVTKQYVIENNNMRVEQNRKESYYNINNAVIYGHMFKYDIVEEIINEELKEGPKIKGRIM